MACPFGAELAGKSSSFLQPHHSSAWHIHSNTLARRSRTDWLLPHRRSLSSLNLPCNAQRKRGLLRNQNGPFSLNAKALCSRVIAQAGRSRLGFLSQNSEGIFSLRLKGTEKRPRRIVVAEAGRSRPRASEAGRSKPRSTQRKRVKRPSGGQLDPAGNIRKKKPDNSKPPEPYVRHPDDYYKFGPHGPYAYKAGVVGDLIPVTSVDRDYVFSWSSIKDLHEQEQADIYDACVLYNNRVQKFDESALQFFYIFARLPFHIGPEPAWKQWTLVAEITVESRESLDKLSLMSRLSDSIRDKITQFTGWFRPDLIYVKRKRRRYQVRFEPETDFIRELESLLMESAGEPNERDSYYGEFCQILGLDVNASHEDITSKYEDSSQEVQFACVEHLLSKHPVQLLPYMPYPNRAVWMAGQSSQEPNKTSKSEGFVSAEPHGNEGETSIAMSDFEDEGPSESDEDEHMEEDSEAWGDMDDPALDTKILENLSKLRDEEFALFNQQDPDDEGISMDSEDEDYAEKEGDVYESDQGVSDTHVRENDSILKAAARPYTYVNLIREMVMLREMLLQQKGNMQQMEAGQA